ncbi:carboxylate-amine ligase [Cryptosporangium phraense]|uniref:Putative glutamate--cysteine ligase 2 n=1 Tax=Cryptosporangium phraense TaxID=2593070 RepID=A0A545APA3_9ACTN|nr:glutamate--cysteine ligase [Cryptosporangium phraense]TQS43158.1 YbdK family carboxylate-amine ligase [Cryptosporangium phraense]
MSTGLTVGVEEEYLLVDRSTGENVPRAGEVYTGLPAELRSHNRAEFRPCMVEMVTSPAVELAAVRAEVATLRTATATAAAAAGARAVAVGATPVGEADRTPTEDSRYRGIVQHYGPIARDPAVCGCHVHVGVPSRGAAVDVCRRVRPWLPVIQALAANSPLHSGVDTGYASWRGVQLDRWPGVGPTPHVVSEKEYDEAVASLVESGVMLDPGLVLWHARPSERYPTVEIRIADVCATVGDAVLVAGLVRALVATALSTVHDTDDPVADHVLEAAHWNAARVGLAGTLLDPRSGRARPAWELVEELWERVTPALLRSGDLDEVGSELSRVRREGNGADRQRAILSRTGSIAAVLSSAELGRAQGTR